MHLESLPSLSAFLLLTVLAPSSIFAQGSNGNSGQPFKDLQDQINNLQQQLNSLSDGTPVSLEVDCNAGDSLVEGLASVPTAVPVTITVSGLCAESVFINRDDVVLQGATPNDGINGIVASIGGSSRVSVNDLTINAQTSVFGAGLACFQGSVITANGLTINGGPRGVWAIDGGKCRVLNSVIDGASTGVESRRHSLVDLEGVTIKNGNIGIDTFLGGSITLQSNSLVTQNVDGVVIRNGSTAEIFATQIDNNSGNGLVVSQGSSVFLVVNSTVSNNGGDGIQLSGLSTGTIFISANAVSGNGGFDLACLGDTSAIFFPAAIDNIDPNCQ